MTAIQNVVPSGSDVKSVGSVGGVKSIDSNLIDFNLIKEKFSLSRLCRGEGFQVRRGSKDSNVVSCPFHFEDTASCHIYDDRRYTCYGCGAKGTIIDFVLKLKPFLGDNPAKAAMYLIEHQGTGREGDYFMSSAARPTRSTLAATAAPPAVHTLKIETERVLANNTDTITAIGDQLFNPRFAEAREYAEARGWLNTPPHVSSYQLGAMAAGEGRSFLSQEAAVAFPKLIQTRRTAEIFGLEKQFEENGRVLCAGIKKRLLPATIEKWEARMREQTNGVNPKDKAPRWICKAGFVTEIPWEFDAHEDADILVICEGPGDGLRLFNEANGCEENRSRWGARWHITAVDSCHIWTVNSIPRRAVGWGSQNYSVSFFDGFSHVIILLDPDAPGRAGAENIVELTRRQNPAAIIRNIVLPEKQDVNDFFDGGNSMADLSKLLRATAPVKKS